jgi:hypothetical protein
LVDWLESVIKLEAPKQVREYTAGPEIKGGRGSRGKRQSGAGTKRNSSETDLTKSNDLKKSKSSAVTVDLSPSNLQQIAIDTTSKFSHTLPVNFYEIGSQLFDEFWNLQFDDKEVNFAFFANITIHNCRDYGLTTFSEHSYSLGVINVSLGFFVTLASISFRKSFNIIVIFRLMIFYMIFINFLQIF